MLPSTATLLPFSRYLLQFSACFLQTTMSIKSVSSLPILSTAKEKVVTEEFVDKALSERIKRIKKYDSRYLEMIKDNTLLINTKGSLVGELNGLTIMTIGDYSFGKPSKITVNTYTGKGGVVNIEREVELSGSSHSL